MNYRKVFRTVYTGPTHTHTTTHSSPNAHKTIYLCISPRQRGLRMRATSGVWELYPVGSGSDPDSDFLGSGDPLCLGNCLSTLRRVPKCFLENPSKLS